MVIKRALTTRLPQGGHVSIKHCAVPAEPNKLSPELLKEVNALLSNANSLLTEKTTKELTNLLDMLGPALTPELLQNVSWLLGNGTTLLSPSFINKTMGLIDGIAPVVTPDLLAQVGGLLNNADDLLSKKFVNETQLLIEDAADVSLFPFMRLRTFKLADNF